MSIHHSNRRPSVPFILSETDAGYHGDGTIRNGRKIEAWVFYCDKVSDETLAKVQKYYPEAKRVTIGSEYAPEIRKPGIYVPTDAELKRRALTA